MSQARHNRELFEICENFCAPDGRGLTPAVLTEAEAGGFVLRGLTPAVLTGMELD